MNSTTPLPWRDEEMLRELYVEEGMTGREIATKFSCSEWTIYYWLNQHGIETRAPGPQAGPWEDREMMQELYVEEGLSQGEIADLLGCTQPNICHWLKRHGIEARPPRGGREGDDE